MVENSWDQRKRYFPLRYELFWKGSRAHHQRICSMINLQNHFHDRCAQGFSSDTYIVHRLHYVI